MQLIKPISSVLVFLCCLTLSAQQQYRFISYNVSNVLSQNSVHCIFQDSDRLLWIGTQDGLNSFDGRNIKSYRYNPADTNSLSDHFVSAINEDANGNIWAGTGHGLNRLNKYSGKVNRVCPDSVEKRLRR